MKFGFGSSAEKNGIPHIERVAPVAAIPGGEMTIHGRGFVSRGQARPVVHFGDAEASLALASENRLIARVPEGANGGTVRVASDGRESSPHPVHIGIQIADNLHPVTNPVVDQDRKSTRLNSSHEWISYAVFCLKKKKNRRQRSIFN